MVRYLFPLLLVGCIHEPASAPLGAARMAPPPNPAIVASCESTRTWHNVWIMASAILGAGASAGAGTAAAVNADGGNKNTITGIDIGLAVGGGLGAISAVAAGIEADTYSTDNCAQILSRAAGLD